MTGLDIAAFGCAIFIVFTFMCLSAGRATNRDFYLANAICGWPVLVSNIAHGAWASVVLTGAFIVAGCLGLWETR